jgi:tetratricopeptide (TPR) repeat protein
LAEAYLRVGQVQGHPAFKNIGDMAGAASSFQQALKLAHDLVQRNPADSEARRDLARAHTSLGDLLGLQSDLPGAVSHYREAIVQLEAVGAGTSADLALRNALSECYDALGDVLGHSGVPNLGDLKGARQAYEKGLSIKEGIVRQQPRNARARGGIAVFQTKIGDTQMDSGDAAAALRAYQPAAAVLDSLSAADPLNTDLRRKVGWVHGKLDAAYEATGQTQAALADYARGIERQRQAMLADPTDIQARMDYAIALKRRAEREQTSHNKQAALVDYRQVIDLLRPLVASEPDNTLVLSRYADMLTMAGGLLGELDQPDEARRLYGEGLSIEKKLADRPDAAPDDIEGYAEGLMDAPVKELLDPAVAIAYARRAVEKTKGEAWFFLDRLAVACSAAGDYAAAVAWDEKALRLMAPSSDRTEVEKRLERFRTKVPKRP